MKLLINYSLNLSAAQRRDLERHWPGLEIREGKVDLETCDAKGVGILVTEPVPKDLGRWPDLRLIQLLSAGANHLRDHPVSRSPIPVATASGTHGVPMAQYATCVWLMMVHRMLQITEFKHTRTWPDRLAFPGFSVRGLTACIVGYGSIGRECARQLSALGMRILAVKRDPAKRADPDFTAWPDTGDPEGKLPEAWFSSSELTEALPHADLVVVTAPSTRETIGLIGPKEFGRMKPSARLIILSRGGIVAEDALAAALRNRQIAEAAVDCFVQEPLPSSHPFFDVPNLILTPHMSGIHDGFTEAFVALLAENVRRLKGGLPLLNRANLDVGY